MLRHRAAAVACALALAAAAGITPASACSATGGIASVYWEGKRTANGEAFRPGGLTAAHRCLPFGTMVRVTNRHNGRSVTVRINDRGPFVRGRVIDLARGAAGAIGVSGLAQVEMAIEGRR